MDTSYPPVAGAALSRDTRGRGIAVLGGGSLALFSMVGTWTPERIFGRGDYLSVMPPRVWAVIGMLVATLFCYLMPFDRGPWSSERRRQTALTALLLLYLVASATWSDARAFATEKALLLALTLCALLLTSKLAHDLRTLLARAFWMWTALASAAYAALTAQAGFLAGRNPVAQRTTVLAGGPNIFSRITDLLALSGITYGTRGGRWVFWYLPAAVGIVLTIGTGSRGGLLAGIVGLLALTEAKGFFRRRGILGAAIVVTAILMAATTTDLWGRAVKVFQQRVVVMGFQRADDSGRSELYRQAWRMGLSAPFLGHGLGGFFVRNRTGEYPHNLFLETFSEGGLLGVALLSVVLYGAIRQLSRRRRTEIGALTWAGFLTLLVACQFSGDLFDSRMVFLLPLLSAAEPAAA